MTRIRRWPGRLLLVESLDSTNRHAARLVAKGETDDFAVVAREQTAGRGRLKRTWMSAPGLGLYCSVVCRPAAPRERYPQLTMTAAVAAVEAVKAAGGGVLSIKWPNDLYHDGRKIGGILCEIAPGVNADYVVVGAGINVLHESGDFPEEIGNASSLAEVSGNRIDIAALTRAFLDAFHSWRLLWEEKGFEPVRDRWLAYDCTVGKMVTIGNDPAAKGIVTGLDAAGCLSVRDERGGIHNVIADDVVFLDTI